VKTPVVIVTFDCAPIGDISLDVSPACRYHYLSVLLLNVFGQIATFWEMKKKSFVCIYTFPTNYFWCYKSFEERNKQNFEWVSFVCLFFSIKDAANYYCADLSRRAASGVGRRSLAWLHCGFESRRGHGCLSLL